MHKAFFSVAGEDIEIAKSVAHEFSAQQIYLYDESGQHGGDIWIEEQDALRSCSVFVVFWSKDYLRKTGTLREIEFAADLLKEKKLGVPLIIRLDDTPLDASEIRNGQRIGHPVLAPLVERWRALPAPFNHAVASGKVRQLLIDNGTLVAPDHDRGTILNALDQLAQLESLREVTPVIWLAGHEGLGRRWIAERFMRLFDPNCLKVEVAMIDSDGPILVLLRLLSKGKGATEELLKSTLKSASVAGSENEILQIVNVIEEISQNGKYVLITLEPLNQDSSKWIPEWFLEVVKRLRPGRLPKLFIVAQFLMSAKLSSQKSFRNQVATLSIPSLDTPEARRYAVKLTGRFDKNANRWANEDIDNLVGDAEGNISLLIRSSKIRSLSRDLKTFDSHAENDIASFSEKLRKYLDTCMPQVRLMPDGISILRVLIDLQLVTFDDLNQLFPNANLPAVVGTLLELGLVESSEDGIYKVPRMVVRRLDSRLDIRQAINSDQLSLNERYKKLFVNLPPPNNEPLIDKIEARIRAFLLAGNAESSSAIEPFLLSAHLVQSGIRAYDRQDYSTALRLLRSCAEKRKEFSESNTRCVFLRYYGLAAAREGAHGNQDANTDIETAVRLLRAEERGMLANSKIKPAADADFILGFSARLQENWESAFHHYKSAILKVGDDSGLRVSDCHRELAETLLHLGPINYTDAIFHAESAVRSRDNILSRDILVKVLIEACWNDENISNNERIKLEAKLDAGLHRLEKLSVSVGAALWHQRTAEDLMFSGEAAQMEEALGLASAAIQISPRPDYHVLKWRILLRIGTRDYLSQLIEFAKETLDDNRATSRTKVMAFRYLISAYLKSGNFVDAERVFARSRGKLSNGVAKQISQALANKEALDLSGWP